MGRVRGNVLADVRLDDFRSGDKKVKTPLLMCFRLPPGGPPPPPRPRSARTRPRGRARATTTAAMPVVEDPSSRDARVRSIAPYESPSARRASGIGGGTRRRSSGTSSTGPFPLLVFEGHMGIGHGQDPGVGDCGSRGTPRTGFRNLDIDIDGRPSARSCRRRCR